MQEVVAYAPAAGPVEARARLARILVRAFSGERAAALAYRGHARSVGEGAEREEILAIERDELHHRECLARMLQRLEVRPGRARERWLPFIGRSIGLSCRCVGRFLPMYGAARLERENIGEYEEAARLAKQAGLPDLCDDLLAMADLEWEHERYFRRKAASHWMWRLFPRWEPPPRPTRELPDGKGPEGLVSLPGPGPIGEDREVMVESRGRSGS